MILKTSLIHLSFNKIDKINNVKQYNKDRKPEGLYYAFGTKWLSFFFNEFGFDKNFFFENELFLYEIFIKDDNILKIKDAKELDVFQNKYHKYSKTKEIDWIKVSKDYYGIELSKYPLIYNKISDISFKTKKIIELVKKYGLQSSILTLKRRHMAQFYTSWDVAGGCIWNNKSIKNFNLLYHKPKHTNDWIKL